MAKSLDLRCTRKSALDLPPGKLRSDPPSFGCSAAIAPVSGRRDRLRCLGGGLRSWLAVR